MDAEVLAEAVTLTRDRRAFALATVVWRRAPSSGRVGAKAIVLPDGSVHGWLGGACAEPTMVREARAALEDGRARLLFFGPPDELAAHELEGALAVPMACESEGALQVYIEPYVPVPQVVIVGRSPAVHALTIQARALEWDVVVVDDGGIETDHPHPELVRTALDFAHLGIGSASALRRASIAYWRAFSRVSFAVASSITPLSRSRRSKSSTGSFFRHSSNISRGT